MKVFNRGLSAIALAAALSGCVSTYTFKPLAPVATGRQEVTGSLSYIIGQTQTVTVGETLVRVRTHRSDIVVKKTYSADRDVTLLAGLNRVQVPGGRELEVVGQRVVDGRTVDIVLVPNGRASDFFSGAVAIQIDDDGIVVPHIMAETQNIWVEVRPSLRLEPPETRFTATTAEGLSNVQPYENYEILYGGASAGSLNFQYREFTATNYARPAFSQTLSYPATTGTIRFRNLSLDILEVGESSITFAVASDGR